jgi:protein-S-isoprenylcysteine O-methyltransferase Ste14
MNELLRVGYHNWFLAGFYILIVGVFIFGILRPRKRVEWRSAGMAQAWVVALYAEMYGLPLTMYVLAGWLGRSTAEMESNHLLGHLWPVIFGTDDVKWLVVTAVAGQLLIVLGAALAIAGWRRIHRAKGRLVTDGIYRRIRHPQYTGFFLFLLGSVINWPTLVTVAMAPVLGWVYYRLARREEADALEMFGDGYRQYRERTSMFLPRWGAAAGARTG